MTSPTRWRTRQRPRSHRWFMQAAATKQNGAVACPTPKALPVTVQAFQRGLLTGSLFNIHSIPPSRPSPPSSVNDGRIKFQMNKSVAKKTHLEQPPPLPGDPGGWGGVSPAGSPPGDLPNASGGRGAQVGPRGFRGPLRGQRVPREVAGSLPPHCHP